LLLQLVPESLQFSSFDLALSTQKLVKVLQSGTFTSFVGFNSAQGAVTSIKKL
jgi:hypothetical protein